MTKAFAGPLARWLRMAPTVLGGALFLFSPGEAAAQTQACVKTRLSDPPRDVIRCGGDLTITAEASTSFRLQGAEKVDGPTGAILNRRALRIETSPGKVRPFQINTPQAIASVRGTIWAIDVGGGRTSVFVQRGAVSVGRGSGRASVVLHPGEGVDVDGSGPLIVKRWPPARVRALLARFGQ
jgi:hypothetical protein